MSGFLRSSSGLNNIHLFHNVDFVVYLEGGKFSFTKEEALSGRHSAETEDVIFWKHLFNKFTVGASFKFKSIGSKKTIKEISDDILAGILNTVYVAMDNEFDELLNNRIIHQNIFYTYGYSWENDVWNDEIIKSIISDLTAVKIEHNDIENNFNNFLKDLKLAVLADGYLFKKQLSFFPRKKGQMSFVDCKPRDLPSIKKNEVYNKLTFLNLKKNTLYAFGRKHSITTHKFCYGHLLAEYCCQLIMHYLKNRHNLTQISKDIIFRICLSKFFEVSLLNGPLYDYYSNQFRRNLMLFYREN